MRLKDRITVITGAGTGIGEATARRFAEEGAVVIVTDIDAGSAERVAAEIRSSGGQAEGQRALNHRIELLTIEIHNLGSPHITKRTVQVSTVLLP